MEQAIEKEVRIYESKVVNATVTVIGRPNIDVWAREIKKLYEDIAAGRYKKGE